MVMGYMCETHGYQRECDVSTGGQRLCYECGKAVTGLTGSARSTYRSPPEDSDHAEGDISWRVSTGYGSGSGGFTVSAFGFEDAVETAIGRVDNPQEIKSVEPSNRRYSAT